MGLDTHNIDQRTDDRSMWKVKVTTRMREVAKWEHQMADSHRNARTTGQKDRKNRKEPTNLGCKWEGCNMLCKTLGGLKAH